MYSCNYLDFFFIFVTCECTNVLFLTEKLVVTNEFILKYQETMEAKYKIGDISKIKLGEI